MGLPKWIQNCREIHRDLGDTAGTHMEGDRTRWFVTKKMVERAIRNRVGADSRTIEKYLHLLIVEEYLAKGGNQYTFEIVPLPGESRLEEFDVQEPERLLKLVEEVDAK